MTIEHVKKIVKRIERSANVDPTFKKFDGLELHVSDGVITFYSK